MGLDLEIANFWINVSLSFITFLAIFIALFKDKFWELWNKPRITFSLKNSEPHIVMKFFPEWIKYFRIKIENTGKTTAKNCCVKLISVTKIDNEENLIEPDELKWANAPKDTRYTNEISSPIYRKYKDLHLGGWEFCDLFRLETSKLIELKFMSSGNRIVDIRDEYLITIEIFGDNFKPKRAVIRTHNPKDNYWNLSLSWIR